MSDFSSLVFYTISFFLSTIFYLLYTKSNKKVYLILSFIIPMIIGGFRYFVGTDYVTYLEMYENNYYSNIGMKIIFKISSYFYGYKTMFFIYNFLTLFFVFLGLKNFNKKSRTIIYFSYLFLNYCYSFNIIKQALAISIIFFAYKYIKNRNLLRWTIFVLFAFCFHTTAIICLPFYFVFTSENKKVKCFLFLLTFLAALNYMNIINFLTKFPLFSHYYMYSNELKTLSNNRMFFIDIIFLIYFLYYKKKAECYDKNFSIFLYIFIIGLMLSFTGFFNPYVKRIADYFLITKIGIIGTIPSSIFDAKDRLINIIFIILLVLTIFIVAFFILRQANVIPYDFIGGNL